MSDQGSSSDDGSSDRPDKGDEARFLRSYSTHQRQVHAYIAAFLANAADVEEVMQDTSVILWRKFGEFDPQGEFVRWACGVARLEVLRFLRQKKRQALPMDEWLIDQISSEREAAIEDLESRRTALSKCLGELRPVDRELIESVYGPKTTARAVAEKMGRPVNAVYKSLGRIRGMLLDCVKRRTLGEVGL